MYETPIDHEDEWKNNWASTFRVRINKRNLVGNSTMKLIRREKENDDETHKDEEKYKIASLFH